MSRKKLPPSNNSFTEFLLYTTPNGKVKVEIFLRNETVWLTQDKIALLFGVQRPAITKHLKNIFESQELQENAVSSILEHTAEDGKKYTTKFYNLDAIISVGYRVNSAQATQFRMWATERLREYIIKGFTMDYERLKNPDIYAQCSADYTPNSDITKLFFATVQNKLHFAITGKTAAEIIADRVDSAKPNMGLTVWKNSPSGAIREQDVVVAKNYLDERELDHLNRIVTMYLDYAESQAQRGILMRMQDWVEKLDAFLQFNERDILANAGAVSHEVAEALALGEYEKYRVGQDRDYISDFDREIKKLTE